MRAHQTFQQLGGLGLAAALLLLPEAPAWAKGAHRPRPIHFASPQAAVAAASAWVKAADWARLARAYDLSLTPQVRAEDLASGRCFVPATSGPPPASPHRRPFPAGSEFVSAEALGDRGNLPCIWSVTTRLQRVTQDCRMIQTAKGYRFLPPAPVEDGPKPAPVPPMAWGAQGADPALFLRPELRERVARELPRGGTSGLPALVAAIGKLGPAAAAHPGHARPGGKPWEPESVYEPSDEEILLSIAGDRVWRTTQIAPLGMVAGVREAHPELPATFEYPHFEVRRIEVAGTGPCYLAAAPVARKVRLASSGP